MDRIMIFDYSLYQLLLYFFVYSFLGWCMEVIYATFRTNTFINRGFLNGPVCPIYGTGVTIVLLCLTPVKDNPFILFFCSVALTTALEFITGFILEKFFHTKWWDYSNQKCNIKGYICLKFSFIWGIICLLVVDIFHVFINSLLMKIPYQVGVIFISIFGVIIITDLVFTVLQMIHFSKISKELQKFVGGIHASSDAIGKKLSDITLVGMEKGETLKKKFENQRLVKAYPNLKKELIEKFNNLKNKKDK